MRWLISLLVALALFSLGYWFSRSAQEARPLDAPEASAVQPAQEPASAKVEVDFVPAAPRAPAAGESAASAPGAAASVPELRIRGRCVDTQGRPISGAEAGCWIYYWATDLAGLDDSGEYFAYPAEAQPRARTDGQGHFELVFAPSKGTGFAAFRVRVRCSAELRARADVALDLARGSSADAGEIVLPLAASLRGRVLDGHGTPVAKARVSAWPKSKPDWAASLPERSWTMEAARSGDDGSFELVRVPPGKFELGARTDDSRESKRVPLEIAEGEVREGLELVLPALEDANSISGIVVSPNGEPVPRARMRILGFLPGRGSSSSGFSCDSEGRFRRELEGRDARLTAEDREDKYGGVALDGIQPGMHNLRLQLPPATQLELHVLDEHGPVETFGWSIKREISKNGFEGSGPVPEAPHAGGRVQIHAPIEPFYIEVQAQGYSSLELGPFRAEALPAEALFRLEPALGIRGVVTSDGKPLAGARLVLWEALGEGRGGTIDNNMPVRMLPLDAAPQGESAEDGSFLLAVDKPGQYHVRATAAGLAPTVSGVLDYEPAAGQRDVRLALTRGGGIEGRAFAADGSPSAARWIVASDGWPPASNSSTDAQGAFRFDHLAPGRYRLFDRDKPAPAQPTGWGWNSNPVDLDARFDCEVREGAVTHFDLRAPQSAEVVLSFPPELAALGEWRVRALVVADGISQQGSSSWSEKRDELSARFPAGGHCKLFFTLPGDSRGQDRCLLSGEFDLAPGKSTQSLGVTFGTVKGRISSAGEQVARVALSAKLGQGWDLRANSAVDAQRAFTFPCAPAGKCWISREGGQNRREVEVKAGETLEIEDL